MKVSSDEKYEKLTAITTEPTAELMETWKMEISGLNLGKPLFHPRPMIDEITIRAMLPVAGRNPAIALELAVYQYATTENGKNAQAMYIYQKKK